MIKIGIIGTGLIARYHGQAIRESQADCRITAICDVDEKKMDEYANLLDLGDVKKYTAYRELIDAGEVDLISVCTGNDMHREISVYAAEKRKHLLCEKPLGLNAAEVKEMAAACEKSGIINMTGFTYRRIPAMMKIKKMIDAGELGKIYHYRGRFYADRLADPCHELEWRHQEEKAGSGVLGDLASHTLDMALYLLEKQCSKIVDVYGDASIVIPFRRDAATGEEVPVTTEESCNVIAHFEDGCEAVLENSRYAPFEMEIHISGEKGAVRYNLSKYDEFELLLYESPVDYFKSYQTVKVPVPKKNGREEPADRMARQYGYIAQCLENNEQAHPTIGETIYIQELLDAIKQSYKQQKRLILP